MFFAQISGLRKALGLTALAVLAIGTGICPAGAGYIVTLEQVGSNVVASGSGALDLTGLSLAGSSSVAGEVEGSIALIITGPQAVGGGAIADGYRAIVGPTSFGSGLLFHADTGSGDIVGVAGAGGLLEVPQGYVSGTALSDISTYNNQTFASLGVTPGTYEWTWGTGPNQNFTLEIGQVPEPASLTLLAAALVGFSVIHRRRKRGMQPLELVD